MFIISTVTTKIFRLTRITLNTIILCIKLFAIFVILVWLSILIYGSFYYNYMPKQKFEKDVNMQVKYSSIEQQNINTINNVEVRDVGAHGGIPQMSVYPWANISFLTDADYVVMVEGQSYTIELEMVLPESQPNMESGMFMVEVLIYNSRGIILKQASRAAILQYKSLLLNVMETLCYSPFLIFGMQQQKQTLLVELFDNYEEDAYDRSTGMYLHIMKPEIQLYSATLKIHAQFRGLRYYMYYWPITTSIVCVSTIMWVECCIAFCFLGFFSIKNYIFGPPKTVEEQCMERLTAGNEDIPQPHAEVLKAKKMTNDEAIADGEAPVIDLPSNKDKLKSVDSDLQIHGGLRHRNH